jgi:hypothetical protein
MELRSDLNRSMTVMLAALCEVRLIAPGSLAALAVSVVQQLTLSEDTSLRFPEFRDELYKVMRFDLGEAEHQAIEAPEIVAHALNLGFNLLPGRGRVRGAWHVGFAWE